MLTLATTLVSLGAPFMVHARDAGDARQAAWLLAGHLRAARQQAIREGRHVGLVFDVGGAPFTEPTTWRVRQCADGNRNGLSRAEIDEGTDRCRDTARPLSAWLPRTEIGRASGVPDLSGRFDTAPVAFGTSRMASFSPLGTASSGSVTVRTQRGTHYAVRVAGVTGRIRVLRFNPSSRQWEER